MRPDTKVRKMRPIRSDSPRRKTERQRANKRSANPPLRNLTPSDKFFTQFTHSQTGYEE